MYEFNEKHPLVAVCKVVHGYRKIPLSRRGHVRGWHPVRRGHEPVSFESTLERDFISWVVLQPGFKAIESQPFTLWLADGRTRYTPDFRVDFATGDSSSASQRSNRAPPWQHSTCLVEIKYEVDWQASAAEQLTQQLLAAGQVLGAPLLVVTDRDLRPQGRVRHD